MTALRLVVAALLLGALGLGAWEVSQLAPSDGGGTGGGAHHQVFVIGPGGDIANGTVDLPDATALSALQHLGATEGFAVEVETLAGFGDGCAGAYVTSIAGRRETAGGGWNYYVRDAPGASWRWGNVGAACWNLAAGQQLEWCWVEGDVCARHHA